MEAEVLIKHHEVDNILIHMGLTRDDLIRSVRYAESERALCTDNDPVGFANMTVYARAGRKLREILVPRGWIKDDTNNQCAVKNPKTKVRIVPCNFDDGAGNRLQTPANKSPKGEVSRRKSMCNRTAWIPGLAPIEEPVDVDGYATWVLGMRIEDDLPTAAELALPVDFDGRYFTQFGKRIILLDGTDVDVTEHADDDTFEVIDITVKRK
ncbi:hypothetical protein F9K90_07535 [Brucella anthropi]|uniref:hypothetical protein n=1 Tax=Brucella anthropi TaxID=529 RepID=UPI00124D6B9D|nr:hypothetical protein [Brucella anthropi]KAB2738524.1 hypothetical protein F9K90_07535 [Brucella anthropi]